MRIQKVKNKNQSQTLPLRAIQIEHHESPTGLIFWLCNGVPKNESESLPLRLVFLGTPCIEFLVVSLLFF